MTRQTAGKGPSVDWEGRASPFVRKNLKTSSRAGASRLRLVLLNRICGMVKLTSHALSSHTFANLCLASSMLTLFPSVQLEDQFAFVKLLQHVVISGSELSFFRLRVKEVAKVLKHLLHINVCFHLFISQFTFFWMCLLHNSEKRWWKWKSFFKTFVKIDFYG